VGNRDAGRISPTFAKTRKGGPATCSPAPLPSFFASVIFRESFRKVDPAQQVLEARVGTKWVESRIHFQVAKKRRAFVIGLFESCDGPCILAETHVNHCELIRRHILCFCASR